MERKKPGSIKLLAPGFLSEEGNRTSWFEGERD
jgi:hypothetical protein